MMQVAVQSLMFLLVPYSYVWIQSILKGSVMESLLEMTPSGSLLWHLWEQSLLRA